MKKFTTIAVLLFVLVAITLISTGCGVQLYTNRGQVDNKDMENRNLAKLFQDIKDGKIRGNDSANTSYANK